MDFAGHSLQSTYLNCCWGTIHWGWKDNTLRWWSCNWCSYSGSFCCLYVYVSIQGSAALIGPWFLVFLQDAIDIARFLLIVFFLVPQALSVSLLDLMTCATELVNCHLKLKATFTVYMQLKSTAQSSAQPAGSLWNAHHLKWFFSLIRVFQLMKKTHVHRYIWSPNLCNLQFGKLQTVGQIWHKGQLKVWLRQWSRLVNGAN